MVCTPLDSAIVVRLDDDTDEKRRKRRSTEYAGVSLLTERGSEERHIRTRRGAVRYRKTEMDCVEVTGAPQPPPPMVSMHTRVYLINRASDQKMWTH